MISKLKKNYDDLQKRYEALIHKQNEGVDLINTFNDRFDSYDLERIHEIQDIQDRLKEEQAFLSGTAGGILNGGASVASSS